MRGARTRFLRRFIAIAHKEAIHITRDPRTVYMALGLPVVLIMIFGYGVSFDLDHVPIGVVDHDRTGMSRSIVTSLTASEDYVVAATPETEAEADRLFREGAASAVFVIPEGATRSATRGDKVPIQVLVDGSDGATAQSVLGNSLALVGAQTRLLAVTGASADPPVRGRVRLLFNPDLRSAVFLVPGLIAYILAIAAVILTALTVAREWERGTMEQLFATPVGGLEIVLGKLAPYLAIGIVQAILVLVVGTVVFDVPVRGSLALLGLGTVMFLTGTLSQGLLVSVLTRNQQLATQAGGVTSLLPSVLLSGFIFPIENMPAPLQVIASIFPSRYFVEILRGVLLKGTGIEVLWPQYAALACFALVMIAIANLRFRRTVG